MDASKAITHYRKALLQQPKVHDKTPLQSTNNQYTNQPNINAPCRPAAPLAGAATALCARRHRVGQARALRT